MLQLGINGVGVVVYCGWVQLVEYEEYYVVW